MTPDVSEFNVTMLGVLRNDFEQWLASRGLVMVSPPGFDQFIVVPQPMAPDVFIAAAKLVEQDERDARCPDPAPHGEHEWYGRPAALRRTCPGRHDQDCPAHDGAACDCGAGGP